jgi:hypothetical protein
MSIQEYLHETSCIVGAMVYAFLSFYFTFTICVWLLSIPFRVMDWFDERS